LCHAVCPADFVGCFARLQFIQDADDLLFGVTLACFPAHENAFLLTISLTKDSHFHWLNFMGRGHRELRNGDINFVSFKRFIWFLRDTGRMDWDVAERLLKYLKQR
jgi:hypothetical protein